jgi:hypothetical protein
MLGGLAPIKADVSSQADWPKAGEEPAGRQACAGLESVGRPRFSSIAGQLPAGVELAMTWGRPV